MDDVALLSAGVDWVIVESFLDVVRGCFWGCIWCLFEMYDVVFERGYCIKGESNEMYEIKMR